MIKNEITEKEVIEVAQRARIEQPIVIIEVGKYAKFEVTYLRLTGDEGPLIKFFGMVNRNWIELLRFECLRNDPSYSYLPETQQCQKYPVDPVIHEDPESYLVYELIQYLPEMMKALGRPRLARAMRQDLNELYFQIYAVERCVEELGRQEKRKSKKPKKAKGS